MTAKKKKSRKWIIGLVVLLIIAVGVLAVPRFLGRNKMPAANQNIKIAAAEAGTIEKTVTGTGNLSTDDTIQDMDIPNNITIKKVLVESGDSVKLGDTLATLDPIVLQAAIYDTQDEISSLDKQLDTAKSKTESKYITASISGRIKQILVEAGNDVAKTMTEDKALMVLSIDGKMIVTFTPATTEGLSAGDGVTVTLSDGTAKDGVIASISAKECSITISDSGPAVDDNVIVTLADKTVLGSGTLKINSPLAISGTNGKVADILVSLDSYIYEGTNVIKLEDAAVSRDYQQLYADRLAKADQLNTLLAYQETNSITAAFDGTIESVQVSDGQSTADASSASTSSTASKASTASTGTASTGTASSATTATDSTMTAFTLKTGSKMELTGAIDELDILSIAVGQKASITLDALPNQTFDGTITKISDIGTVSSGVTTYDVTLSVSPETSMKVGMNASATISIEKRDNIIKIPLEALQESGKEQFVYVGTAISETYLGEKRTVTTGISDGEFVEITGGLSAGEKINYVYTSGTTTSAAATPFGGGALRNIRSSAGNQTPTTAQ